MNLQQLKVFAAVAQYKKMNIAAEKLYLTESAVSQTISRLERQHGIELFERLNKSIYITPAGEGLLFYARQMLDLDQEALDYLNQLRTSHHLRVGGTGIITSSLISRIISQLQEINCELILYNHTPTYTLTQIRNNKLDIAFVSDSIISVIDTDFVLLPFLHERGIVVCSRSHPFWDRGHISPNELRDQPFIVSDETGGFSTTLESYLLQNNIPVAVKGNCNDAVARKNMILHLPYLTFSSYGLCQDDIENGQLREIKLDGISFEQHFCLLHHKDKYLSPPLKKLIHICTNEISADKQED